MYGLLGLVMDSLLMSGRDFGWREYAAHLSAASANREPKIGMAVPS
jgi:hypothetical protein